MKIKKKNTTIPISGKIVDTENVEDKTSNAPSLRLVEEMTKDIYSKEEQVIGLIDDKLLYRKTIRGTAKKINETYTIDTISDLKEVTDVRGTALAVGKYFTPFNTMLNTELQNILQVDAKTGAVLVLFGKAFLSNKYTAIVEYTKNTD